MKARNFHSLIKSVSSGSWYINHTTAMGYLPLAIALLKGENPQGLFDDDDNLAESAEVKKARMERWKNEFRASSTELYVEDYYYDYLPLKINSNVVVIPIIGPILKEDYCGAAGLKTITAWYEKAAKDPDIVGIIELADSGGGSVFGTDELANYKTSYPKPVVDFVEGLCCSAMQYIAAASAYRIASSKNCIFGSIGVMTTLVDFTKYYADAGIDIYDLYSKTSPLKNSAYREAIEKKNFKGYTDGILYKMDQNFMGFAKQQLPNLTEAALQGADFIAEEAIANGLLDEIGTFQQAYDKVIELHSLSEKSNNKTPNKMSKKTVKLSAFMAGIAQIFGAEIEDDTNPGEKEEVTDSPENKDINKPDETEEPDKKDSPNSNNTAESTTVELTADQKTIAELRAQVDALKKAPGNNATRLQKVEKTSTDEQNESYDWTKSSAAHVEAARSQGLI